MGVVRPRTPIKAALSARAAARQQVQAIQQQQASLGREKPVPEYPLSSSEQRPTAPSSYAVSPLSINAFNAYGCAVYAYIQHCSPCIQFCCACAYNFVRPASFFCSQHPLSVPTCMHLAFALVWLLAHDCRSAAEQQQGSHASSSDKHCPAQETAPEESFQVHQEQNPSLSLF